MNRVFITFFGLAVIVVFLGCASVESTVGSDHMKGRISLSPQDQAIIGRKIWQNECGGTVSGLTSWNKGEDFPSLGIGHFIWYVKGRPGPFDESFPKLVQYMAQRGKAVPGWVVTSQGCPWNSRSQFLAEKNSPRMSELRNFLAATVDVQTGFIIQRLEDSLPKMKAATPNPSDRDRLEKNFYNVAGSRAGMYALIDYVNFKGEGIKPSESYNGEGWGLQDVLLEMKASNQPANYEFSEAAKRTLQNRVRNSPASRGENRWLNGWMVRCEGYKKGI
ncbi:MAG: hypothetical protein P1V20_24985 [Verrucomicrobiales bacterium]|nr:hypothetical protein [Verrucomicrobiales bacterium]